MLSRLASFGRRIARGLLEWFLPVIIGFGVGSATLRPSLGTSCLETSAQVNA